MTQSLLLDYLFSLLSKNNTEKVTLHSEGKPHACSPGGGKHTQSSNTRVCHPRCCNQTLTRGCSLSALTKHQQMDNVSTASPFPLSLGDRCSLKKGSQSGFRCDRSVNSQAAIRKSFAAAKNVLFGTPLDVFCVYSNGFTSFSSLREGIRRTSKKYEILGCLNGSVSTSVSSCSSWLAGSETPARALPEQPRCFLIRVEHLFQWEPIHKSPQISIS